MGLLGARRGRRRRRVDLEGPGGRPRGLGLGLPLGVRVGGAEGPRSGPGPGASEARPAQPEAGPVAGSSEYLTKRGSANRSGCPCWDSSSRSRHSQGVRGRGRPRRGARKERGFGAGEATTPTERDGSEGSGPLRGCDGSSAPDASRVGRSVRDEGWSESVIGEGPRTPITVQGTSSRSSLRREGPVQSRSTEAGQR